jgi:MFS superfamily sulfate permease-like transporter
MLGWEKLPPQALRLVPGALVGVVGATLVAWGFGLDVVRVAVPDSLASAVDPAGA